MPRSVRRQGVSSLVLTVSAISAVFVLLCLLYAQIARTVVVNSDHASIVLEAAAVLHGNPLLRGWTLTNVSFYTLDLPFYVAAVAWRGVTPEVMREVPAVVYALTVLAAVWLAGRGQNRQAARLGGVTTFLILGLPSLFLPQVVLVGVDHIATALVMVAALLAFDMPDGRPLSKGRAALLCAFCILLMVGDTISLWVFILPIVVVSLARSCRTLPAESPERNKRQELVFIAVGMLSILAPEAFGALMHAIGGFTTLPLDVQLVSLSDLPATAALLMHSLLTLFRADVLSHTGAVVKTAAAVDLLGLIFVFWSLALALKVWGKWRGGGDRVIQVLGIGMTANLIGYLANSAAINPYNTLYSPSERYLIPCFVFGAILAGRLGVEFVTNRKMLKGGLALLGIASTVLTVCQLQRPHPDPSPVLLARWLQARQLTHGFGNFWCSSLITVDSGGAVLVRPVASRGKRIGAMSWFSDKHWYAPVPATFLVYDVSHLPDKSFYWQNIDLETARITFGPPSEVNSIGPYTVLVWKKNITPDLEH